MEDTQVDQTVDTTVDLDLQSVEVPNVQLVVQAMDITMDSIADQIADTTVDPTADTQVDPTADTPVDPTGDTIMVHLAMEDTIVDTTVDLYLQIVGVQNVQLEGQAMDIIVDPTVDITVDPTVDIAVGLTVDHIPPWLEYWLEDLKQRQKKILLSLENSSYFIMEFLFLKSSSL